MKRRTTKRNPVSVGTDYFPSFGAAVRYYKDYGEDRADVEAKVKRGDIHIGKPKYNAKAGERLKLVDGGKRYAIERPNPSAGPYRLIYATYPTPAGDMGVRLWVSPGVFGNKKALTSAIRRQFKRAGQSPKVSAIRHRVEEIRETLPKRNPSQVATVVARGNKKVFVVATDSSESNEALLDRVNAIRVIKRINTNPFDPKNKLGVTRKELDTARRRVLSAKDGEPYNNAYRYYWAALEDAGYSALEAGRLADHAALVRAERRGTRNPSPVNEWDDEEFSDEELNEASRQGWLGATAMRREHAKRAAGPKFFSVTWYSKQRGKRTGFMRPIEARTQSEAIKQAKAMINNEKTVSNFVAKEAKHNPANGYHVYAQIPPDKKFSKFWYADLELAKRFAASVIKDGGKTYIAPVKRKPNPSDTPARDRLALEGIHYVTSGGKGAQFLKGAIVRAERERDTLTGKARTDLTKLILKGKRELRRTGKASVKHNPSTRAMSQRFNGHASGAVVELKASNSAPLDLSRAGRLVLLKLADRNTQLRIPGAVVCIDPKTERLWIAGNRSPLLNRKAKPGERLNCGEIDRIVYETAKRHIGGGKTFEYDHKFGEDGGRKPSLYIDADGMPLIVGGDYKIRREGIVN